MLKHTGSARDPLPTGGYSNGEGGGAKTARWVVLAVAVVAVGAAIVAGGGFLPSDVSARIAGAFSPRG